MILYNTWYVLMYLPIFPKDDVILGNIFHFFKNLRTRVRHTLGVTCHVLFAVMNVVGGCCLFRMYHQVCDTAVPTAIPRLCMSVQLQL